MPLYVVYKFSTPSIGWIHHSYLVEGNLGRKTPILTKDPSMIDARNPLLATAQSSPRRGSVSNRKKAGKKVPLLKFPRTFSNPKIKPFDEIEWDKRTAEITDDAGKVIFKQENVE